MNGSEFSIARTVQAEIISGGGCRKMKELVRISTYIIFKFLSDSRAYSRLVLFFCFIQQMFTPCVHTAGWVLWKIQRWMRSIHSRTGKEDISHVKFSNILGNMMMSN